VIRRILSVLSALCFMLGAVGMVLGATVAWMYCVVTLATGLGWFAGFVGLFGSLLLASRYERQLKAPWLWWYEYWRYCDEALHRRI
jgi:membrane associated rhomboid family serine protease